MNSTIADYIAEDARHVLRRICFHKQSKETALEHVKTKATSSSPAYWDAVIERVDRGLENYAAKLQAVLDLKPEKPDEHFPGAAMHQVCAGMDNADRGNVRHLLYDQLAAEACAVHPDLVGKEGDVNYALTVFMSYTQAVAAAKTSLKAEIPIDETLRVITAWEIAKRES